jgi:flagellar biogenesis protein FliO
LWVYIVIGLLAFFCLVFAIAFVVSRFMNKDKSDKSIENGIEFVDAQDNLNLNSNDRY